MTERHPENYCPFADREHDYHTQDVITLRVMAKNQGGILAPPGKVWKRETHVCAVCGDVRYEYYLVDTPDAQAYILLERALVKAWQRVERRALRVVGGPGNE